MPAILEMPAAPPRLEIPVHPAVDPDRASWETADFLSLHALRARVSPVSVEAYEALARLGMLDGNTELLCGVIVKKMAKSALHCFLIEFIYLHLLAWQRAGWVVLSERPLRLASSLPEPDAMIVRGSRRDFKNKHPTAADLVVEVAVSSVEVDRKKAALYAQAGVAEYWIALAEEQQVEVHRQLENGAYQQKQLYTATDTLPCASVPELQVNLAEWFA